MKQKAHDKLHRLSLDPIWLLFNVENVLYYNKYISMICDIIITTKSFEQRENLPQKKQF